MQVNIKITDELYSALRERAKKNKRTIRAELELILENTIETTNINTIETTNKQQRKNIIEDEKDSEGGPVWL